MFFIQTSQFIYTVNLLIIYLFFKILLFLIA